MTFASFIIGNGMAWTSPVLPHVDTTVCGHKDQPKCDFDNIVQSQVRYLAPMYSAGAAIMGLLIGRILDIFGRRYTMMGLCVPMIIGGVLQTISRDIHWFPCMLIGRALTGIGSGIFTVLAPMYVSETAVPKLRGALSNMLQLQANLGMCFVDLFAINGAVDWMIMTAVCTCLPGELLHHPYGYERIGTITDCWHFFQ